MKNLLNLFSTSGRTSLKDKELAAAYYDATRLGLFDAQWYQNTYGLYFKSPQKAFANYIRKSAFAPVHPSPVFDNETYHRMYSDVYHSQTSPLLHYLSSGRQEGRTHQSVATRWKPNNVMDIPLTITEAGSAQKVAIHLHIFYEDFIERFAVALRHFPVKVDLFLTLAKDQYAASVKKHFGTHPRIKNIKTKTVPNHGRNFGPLLVEFAEELSQYDLFCHLHSKKSLYSGKEQTQWAEYLTEYLLRDSSVATRVLNAFAEDEALGIYYPTAFWLMPAWVNHQTMNKPFMKKWQKQLNIDYIPDFMSYPVGGMFWARPQALKGVLDQPWSYQDFPEEPLPNDGSMLHALERILTPLTEKNGYAPFFYYPASGTFTQDTGFTTASYHGSFEQHTESVHHYPSISFDIFDTLVCRDYTAPDYAKLQLGQELVATGHVSSAQQFIEQRNTAELSLRKRRKFKGDIIIHDIYIELAKQLNVEEKLALQWMEREFELDLLMLQPKEEMVDLYNQLNLSKEKTVWLISDTYYTTEQIELVLQKTGVTHPSHLLISSEEQARKDNGSMWQMFKEEQERLNIKQHIHIGDNVVSDAQRPGDLGIPTLHILHPMDKWQALGFPQALTGDDATNETQILKWGKLINHIGRNPWIGE